MTADVHGPIDFVLLEFTGNRLTGRAAEELLRLVDLGIIHVYDILIVGKDQDGAPYSVDIAESPDQVGGFAEFHGAQSGLLADDDIRQAADAMQPGSLAAIVPSGLVQKDVRPCGWKSDRSPSTLSSSAHAPR